MIIFFLYILRKLLNRNWQGWNLHDPVYTLSQVSCFLRFLLNILININIFVLKLCSSTTMKKVQIFCFKMPPYCFRVQYTTKNKKSTGILHGKQHVKFLNDNVEKLRELFWVLQIGEKMLKFLILNPVRNLFLFILISRCKKKWIVNEETLDYSPCINCNLGHTIEIHCFHDGHVCRLCLECA